MMLRVNGEFLDFNDFVDVEKRVKLFENIEKTLGDFSYSFELEPTAKNLQILGNPSPDNSAKTIYRQVPCELLNEAGSVVYYGAIRVEKILGKIQASFFSGNFNWISLLGDPLSDLDLSDLQTDLNIGDIANTWDNEDGVIFPLIDSGALITRSFESLMVEDFSGMIFVKTLFKRVFQSVGVKVNGDLLKDPIFNTLLLSKMTLGPEDIDSLTAFVKMDNDLVIATGGLSTSDTKIEFDNDSSYPYFDGESDAYDPVLFRYTAPVKEKVIVEVSIIKDVPGAAATLLTSDFVIRQNGVDVFSKRLNQLSGIQTDTIRYVLTLELGDYIEGWFHVSNGNPGSVNVTVKGNSTIKITPSFIYRTKGQALVPNWTKAKFVSNILSLFCCITDYDPISKTLTIDFFDGIKDKEPIDLSEHLEVKGVDYSEFIDNFGQKSLLSYEASDEESVKQYNIANFVAYGAGEILVDNDFIEETADIVKSDFKSPISYLNQTFGASLERTQFVELEDNGQDEFTSVVDSAGYAKFNVPDDSIYSVGELVRITESSNPVYNGEYVISSTGAGLNWIIVEFVFFNTDATGKITKLLHKIGSDDGVYLFINTKYRVANVSTYSSLSDYYISGNPYNNVAYAFFNLLNTNQQINTEYMQGLSFGAVDNPLSYQRTLIDKYWGLVGKVLNDPVKVTAIGNIPKIVYDQITPLRPIRIKTDTTNNLYYLNRIYGYKESYLPCDVELIKLS